MPIIKTLKKEKDFVQIDNALARNVDLTYEAKGMLLELLSRPANWKVRKNQLARPHTKQSKITRIVKELQTHGYCRIIQVRNENNQRIKDRLWIISESPKTEEEWLEIDGTFENLKLRESALETLDFLKLRESALNNTIKETNTYEEHTSNTKVLEGSLSSKESSTSKKKIFTTDSVPYVMASYQLDSVLETVPNFRGKDWEGNKKYRERTLQSWADVHDKMIRLDKRDDSEIMDIIDFVAKDSFWCTNVLSAGKLRDQYDRLLLQMNNRKSSPIESRQDVQTPLEDPDHELTQEIIIKYCQLIGTNLDDYNMTQERKNKFIQTTILMTKFFSRSKGRIMKTTWVDFLMRCMQLQRLDKGEIVHPGHLCSVKGTWDTLMPHHLKDLGLWYE